MLTLLRLTPAQLSRLHPISDASLAGEESVLRIGRGGFSLGYVPLDKAQWRSFPPPRKADPAKLVTRPDAAAYAAFAGEALAGLACIVFDQDSAWTEIIDLRVDAAYRRQGVASTLLRTCEDASARQGMRGLKMAVPDSNPAACQFCEHCGFTLQGVDRYALLSAPSERDKPAAARACALLFYRPHQKG